MNRLGCWLLFALAALILLPGVFSEDVNQSLDSNTTTQTNSSTNQTSLNASIPEPAPSAPPPLQPATPPASREPEPKATVPAIIAFDVQKVLPGDVKLGDTQVNILVANTGNQPLTNVNALIAGEGVSVYNQEPIGLLAPGDSKWILAWLNTKKTGKIPLDVRIQDKAFRISINVIDSEQTAQAKRDVEEQLALKRRVRELQEDLGNLSDIYEAFQRDYILKESKGYQLTTINLQDAKTYLRTAQSSLAKGDLSDASAQLVLLRSELSDLREKLLAAQPKPRTWKDPLKENIAILSGIIGVLVGGLAVYEKLKRKTEDIKKNGGLFGKPSKEEEPK